MQIRWRTHEILFVTILTISQILLSLSALYNSSHEKPGQYMSSVFERNGIPFDFQRDLLIPQITSVLLVYIIYILISQLIVPALRRVAFSGSRNFSFLKAAWVMMLILVVGYFFSIGVNIISYYARPSLTNYAGYQMLGLLGYNEKPLENLYFGFSRAILFVGIATIALYVRELMVRYVDRAGPRRNFRVLVANNLTLVLCIGLLILVAINPVHSRFLDYLAWAIPILLLHIYTTFWLFPSNDGFTWRRRSFVIKLLISTFAGAAFSAIVFSGSHELLHFFMSWAVFLLIMTPLNWLLYLQRKDRILQLKGLETDLVKSNTALQMLRSQINPHFLFNSFNALYGIALKERSRQTAEGIQILGDMMRFMLHDNTKDTIPMVREIDYLKNYIYLQKLRIPDATDIRIEDNINIELCYDEAIAPMLLIPFVENAFKHGINPDEKSWIIIKLECNETFIHFEVKNSAHSEPAYGREENYPGGVGLKNVNERLKLLYPGKHELKTGALGNEFIASLMIYKN